MKLPDLPSDEELPRKRKASSREGLPLPKGKRATKGETNGATAALSQEEDSQRRRFIILASSLGLLMAAILGGLLLFASRGDDGDVAPQVTLTQEEQGSVDSLVREFVAIGGTWGLKEEYLQDGSVERMMKRGAQSSQAYSSYWNDRQMVYPLVLKNYLASWGDLSYSPSEYGKWYDPIARESLSTFKTTPPQVTTSSNGVLLQRGGQSYKMATTQVNSMTKQTRRIRLSDDVEWDGTFSVEEKTFQDSYQVTSVLIPGVGWRVYSVSGMKHPFTLVTWKNVGEEYYEDQFDFTRVGTIKGK